MKDAIFLIMPDDQKNLQEEGDDLVIFLGTKGENGSVVIDPESGRAFLQVVDDKIWGV